MRKTAPKIRFAVVGLGHIAQTAVLPAFQHARRDVELRAFVSGDATKLEKLGKKYGVKSLYSYEDYNLCLESGEIDAVYIALPNHMHAEFAVRAFQRGIHVLCEKPLALTESDCRRIVEAAAASGCKLMTAYRLHFDQANLKAVKMARKKLGDLRYFSSNFGYQIRDLDNIRLKANEGGSPLWDLGVYCINAARYFFRDEPTLVSAVAVRGAGARFRETKEMVAATLKFPGDRLATFTCSFGSGDQASYDVVGEKGSLRMEAAYEYVMSRELTLKVGEKAKKLKFKKSDQFAPELVYFAECIHKNRTPEPSGFEGWADVRIIRALEQSMSKGSAVLLPRAPVSIRSKARPQLKQWIQRPPVKVAPKTVHSDAPGGN